MLSATGILSQVRSQLPRPELRRIVDTLLLDPAVNRLLDVRQLGFASLVSSNASYSRFDHMAHSLSVVCALAGELPKSKPGIFGHIIAAAMLQDCGQPPFSHSLDKVFRGIGEQGGPHDDIERACWVVREREASQGLLKRLGLEMDLVLALIRGDSIEEVPTWIKNLFDSELDIDRAVYLSMDAACISRNFDPTNVLRSLIKSRPPPVATVDSVAIGDVIATIVERFELHKRLYFHPIKLGAQRLLELFFNRLWSGSSEHLRCGEESFAAPRTVVEFLLWSDTRVLGLLKNPPSAIDFGDLRRIAEDSGYCVAEVDAINSSEDSSIGEYVRQFQNEYPNRTDIIIIPTDELPKMSIYRPNSICVETPGGFKWLEDLAPQLRTNEYRRPWARRPLAVILVESLTGASSVLRRFSLRLGCIHLIKGF